MDFNYIHIPKSAGTFMTRRLVNINDNVYEDGHSRCISDKFLKNKTKDSEYYSSRNWFGIDLTKKKEFDESIKFTTIRNPYDLLSSYFVSRFGDYDAGLERKLPHKDFNGLIKEFCGTNEWHLPFLREFLYFQLFDDEGNSRCDYAIIYNHLEDGISEFANKNNLNFNLGGRENSTGKKQNKSYKSYYNDETIELVKNKCKLELDMFGFDFDGFNGTSAIVNMSEFKVDWNNILK